MFNRVFNTFSKDIGIDLGTANTLVYVKGKGVVINEPSVVAINKRTGQVLAVGSQAQRMVGKTPLHIAAVRPLVDGVISDFEVTEQMIKYFINKVHQESFSVLSRPRVVVGIPSGVTEVERRAVEEACLNAGARKVYLIEEPMAAAIGARLPVQDAAGSMVVDIGGGTTEVAVISLGGAVAVKSLRVAGDEMNENIIQFARDNYNLLLGERTAEQIKIKIGSAWPLSKTLEEVMRGRDLLTGLPKAVTVNDEEVRSALSRSVKSLTNSIKDTIENTPPELLADIMHQGIALAGGGALLRGFDRFISKETQVPVHLADDPLTCVVRGTGLVLEDLDGLKEILVATGMDQKAPT